MQSSAKDNSGKTKQNKTKQNKTKKDYAPICRCHGGWIDSPRLACLGNALSRLIESVLLLAFQKKKKCARVCADRAHLTTRTQRLGRKGEREKGEGREGGRDQDNQQQQKKTDNTSVYIHACVCTLCRAHEKGPDGNAASESLSYTALQNPAVMTAAAEPPTRHS